MKFEGSNIHHHRKIMSSLLIFSVFFLLACIFADPGKNYVFDSDCKYYFLDKNLYYDLSYLKRKCFSSLICSDGFNFEAEVGGLTMKISIGVCNTVDDPCISDRDDLITLKGSIAEKEVCMSSPGTWEEKSARLAETPEYRRLELRYPDSVNSTGHVVYTKPTMTFICNEDVKDWTIVGGAGISYQFETVHGERFVLA
eukprot:TRINITY_DN9622_c0_g1_i28.p1 TRINITY_DN9622_c0_g1~~TRINITY_DN9622_c0_g1_i28.p1  ORF type:complete len:198 (-),score=33.38 TRINITY_DN9622_c0_g1_i28:863-1456(-)